MVGFVLAGAGLRLWNLRDQVMGGDELHAVRAVAERSAARIVTQYSLVDYSLPITAFHRLLLDWGVSLSEMDFRLPAILCGLLAMIVLPRAWSGRVGRFPAELYGWLVAFSPLFVVYSRIARSYMPMVLLSFAAVMAFERWWNSGSRRAGVAYVVFGALAVWVHLGAGPIVASPFLFAVGDLVRSRAWRRLRELVAIGLAIVAAMALYLVPAGPSLLKLVGNKHREIDIPWRTAGNVLVLEAGTRSWTLTALFWAAALAGLVLLLRRDPRLGLFTLTVTLGHLAGILVLSPLGLNLPIVLNRYLLPVLPFVLLWVAVALGRTWIPHSGLVGVGLQRTASRLFIAFLFWTGPFLTHGYRDSSFMHHNDFVGFYNPLSTIPDEAVPGIYKHQLPDAPVIEAPWSTVWEQNRTFYIYQLRHQRRVIVSAPFDVPRGPGFDFRNEVEPEPAAFLASPARLLIVHLRVPWEEDRVVIPGRPFTRPMPPGLRRVYRRIGEKLAARLAAEWGQADYSDSLVRVWDLDRVRGSGRK
ncbi:MAG: glycosyltransferase family 39 protein [Acidobacteriota bacterium]